MGWRLDGKNTEKGRDKRLGMQGRRVEMTGLIPQRPLEVSFLIISHHSFPLMIYEYIPVAGKNQDTVIFDR